MRTPAELAAVDAVVIPGGESTTISKLLDLNGLFEPLRQRLADGMPALGHLRRHDPAGRRRSSTVATTSAASGAIDIDVRRNAFGRQIDSFEADLPVRGLDATAARRVHPRTAGGAGG